MADEFIYPGPPRNWPEIQVLRRVWRVSALLRTLHQPHFDRIGLPMVEFDMLAVLGNTPGFRMKDLADAMITTPSNVTRVCSVMEEKGLVRRRRSSDSDREVVASLTPEGEALFHELFPKTVNYGARVIDSALEPDEQRVLAALLDKLLRNLKGPDQPRNSQPEPYREP